jgi:phosphate-selective porin OprO/OprP
MPERIQKLGYVLFAYLTVLSGVSLFAAEISAGRNAPPASVVHDTPVERPEEMSNGSYHGSLWDLRWDDGLYYDFGPGKLMPLRARRREERDLEPLHGRIGFRLHVDAADYDADDSLETFDDTIDIRRLRLYTQGEFFFLRPASFKIEADYTDEDFYWREAFISFRGALWDRDLKIGHFRSPLSLEAYGGGRAATFMEYAAPVQAFQPGIKFGAELSGMAVDDRMTYSIGWFADGEDADIGESSTSFTRGIGRVTVLPYYADGGRKLVHLGVGGHYLFSDQSEVRYRSRPESRFAPYIVDTGEMDADQAALWNLEAAVVNGSCSLQAEVFQTTVFAADEGDPVFYGGYLYASWMLTGETRPYDRASGTFQLARPARRFSIAKKTPGAWELGLRLSYLDLSTKGIEGGELTMTTAGLNWYLSRRLRIMFNYGHGEVRETTDEGDVDIFHSRLQVDF